MHILVAVAVFLLLWSAWGLASSRVEQAAYEVLDSGKEYEVRLYPEHIVAETTVEGGYEEALNEGFRIIANYIFGANAKKETIAMTAPVAERKGEGEKIAMTAPVLATLEGESHTISFVMPRAYTLDTLPAPVDPRVKLVAIPEKRMAAMRFSWLRTPERVESKKQMLLKAVQRDNLPVKGEAVYAGYNDPLTPPWMTRNEVMVEIAEPMDTRPLP